MTRNLVAFGHGYNGTILRLFGFIRGFVASITPMVTQRSQDFVPFYQTDKIGED